MATPSPTEDPQFWSFVSLAGEQLPCVAEVTGTTGWDMDVKKTKGTDGPTIQDNGITPAKLSMKLTILPIFWAKTQEILERVAPSQIAGKRKPVEIRNAATDARGIHSVYVTEVGLPTLDSKGMISQTVGLLQWVPQPKAAKASSGANAKSPKSAVERDPFAPGSLVRPLNKPILNDTYESGHGTQEDKDFLDFMQNAI